MRGIRVVAIGDVNVDVLTTPLAKLPERDSQVLTEDLSLSVGGCAANFAYASSRLGMSSWLQGKVGDDWLGEFITKKLAGVHCSLKVESTCKTGVTLALVLRDGSRSFITFPGCNRELNFKDINLKLVDGEYLHLPSFSLTGLGQDLYKLIDHAHSKGMLVSFDPGPEPGGWSKEGIKTVRDIISKVDIVELNLNEARAITGLETEKDVLSELAKMGPSLIAVKLGERGCIIRKGEEEIKVPSYKIEVVDSTGAGDVFDAALVYAHAHEMELEEMGKFANAAGALSCRAPGNSAYPEVGEVKKLIASGEQYLDFS